MTTTQFRVDRFPHHAKPPHNVTPPVVIWVELPPCGVCVDQKPRYRVERKSARRAHKAANYRYRGDAHYHVCGCMGEVIE